MNATENKMPNYLTYDDLSEKIKLSKSTLQKYVSARKIPFTKAGKRVLFEEQLIVKWLISKRKKCLY